MANKAPLPKKEFKIRPYSSWRQLPENKNDGFYGKGLTIRNLREGRSE